MSMAIGTNLKKAARTVKSATRKAARAVKKTVVEPIAGMFEGDGRAKSRSKKKATISSSRTKGAKKSRTQSTRSRGGR
jgi:hypothetical protein